MMVQETRTLADGKKQVIEEIFTNDAAYGRRDNLPWRTVQLARPQRAAYSPENVEQKMSLGTCEYVSADDYDGQAASLYSITYLPDADGSRSSGKIWIADATGLTLRQEIQGPANSKLAIDISARYFYGDDVKVPRAAELAEFEKHTRVSQWLLQLQQGHPAAWAP
jgi:hypothetical protein